MSFKTDHVWCRLAIAGLVAAAAVCPRAAGAAEDPAADDPARGMTRLLNIEEPWVENAVYGFAQADNAFTAGHGAVLEGEADFALSDRWGGEVDVPQVLLRQPFGHGAAAFGPVAAGLRYVAVQRGTPTSLTAGVWSVELEGAVSPFANAAFPELGNSWTAETMGALRWGVLSMQMLAGLTRPAGRSGPSGWFANTGLAISLGSGLITQIEADLNGAFPADDRSEALAATALPEIGYQAGEWTVEAGLALGSSLSDSATILMLERDL